MRVWRGKDDVKSLVLLLYFGESTQLLFTEFHFCTEYQTLLTLTISTDPSHRTSVEMDVGFFSV